MEHMHPPFRFPRLTFTYVFHSVYTVRLCGLLPRGSILLLILKAFRIPGMSNRFHNSFLELHFLEGASTMMHFYWPMIALLLLFLFSPSESSFFSLSNVMSTSPYHSPHPNQNLHEKLMDVFWGGICRRGTLFPNYFHAMDWIRK